MRKWYLAKDKVISIHAPMWGATKPSNEAIEAYLISIHAPMWGATPKVPQVAVEFYISIHAPMWGATRLAEAKEKGNIFQSTHPCGVRP